MTTQRGQLPESALEQHILRSVLQPAGSLFSLWNLSVIFFLRRCKHIARWERWKMHPSQHFVFTTNTTLSVHRTYSSRTEENRAPDSAVYEWKQCRGVSIECGALFCFTLPNFCTCKHFFSSHFLLFNLLFSFYLTSLVPPLHILFFIQLSIFSSHLHSTCLSVWTTVERTGTLTFQPHASFPPLLLYKWVW